MPINFFTEDSSFRLKNKRKLKSWILDTVQLENCRTGEINYIFTSDKYLLNINKQYLSHNYYTDIITFNYCENKVINGDIYISIDTVKNNSTRFTVTFNDELNRVMIHGILHLLGYDDHNEKEKLEMREKENYYLERLKNLS